MGGVAGDLRNSAVGQIGIVLGLCAHGGCSSFINNFAAGFATAPVHPDRMPHEGKPKKIAPTAKTVEVIVFLLLSAVDTDLTLTLIVPVLEALDVISRFISHSLGPDSIFATIKNKATLLCIVD